MESRLLLRVRWTPKKGKDKEGKEGGKRGLEKCNDRVEDRTIFPVRAWLTVRIIVTIFFLVGKREAGPSFDNVMKVNTVLVQASFIESTGKRSFSLRFYKWASRKRLETKLLWRCFYVADFMGNSIIRLTISSFK